MCQWLTLFVLTKRWAKEMKLEGKMEFIQLKDLSKSSKHKIKLPIFFHTLELDLSEQQAEPIQLCQRRNILYSNNATSF
jgi:hypothetical protein